VTAGSSEPGARLAYLSISSRGLSNSGRRPILDPAKDLFAPVSRDSTFQIVRLMCTSHGPSVPSMVWLACPVRAEVVPVACLTASGALLGRDDRACVPSHVGLHRWSAGRSSLRECWSGPCGSSRTDRPPTLTQPFWRELGWHR
jgi:hypothetical protein